jgi:hypothetical protein
LAVAATGVALEQRSAWLQNIAVRLERDRKPTPGAAYTYAALA